jgi:hypothetical protein
MRPFGFLGKTTARYLGHVMSAISAVLPAAAASSWLSGVNLLFVGVQRG